MSSDGVDGSHSVTATQEHGENQFITDPLTKEPDETQIDFESDMDIVDSDSSDSSDDLTGNILDDEDSNNEETDSTQNMEHGNSNGASSDPLGKTPLYILPQTNENYKSSITYHDHVLAVSAYCSRHNLSDTAFKDLLHLIQLHIPDNSLLETNINKMKDKCGFAMNHLTFHTFCTVCENVFSSGTDRCQTPGCVGRKVKSRSNNYFVTGKINKQLEDILTKKDIWQSITERASTCISTSTITDILDGSEYRKLKTDGQFLSDKNNISLSFFTDGIPLFKSSGVSLWPVYLIINEIPRQERFLKKNMLLWGIWQGTGKPNMTVFLKSLVLDLQKLYTEGINLEIEGEEISCKVMLLVGTMDLPARAGVLHMTQYNGEYSCIFCMHPGAVVRSGNGYCRSFPYVNMPLRTTEDIKKNAADAHESRKRINGITGISVFNYLPYFSLCNNIVIDYMHGILLGICKKLLGLWFNASSFEKPYFVGNRIKEVDHLIKNIAPPYLINRLPRKLSNTLHHWKASELRSWLLFYSLPCLKDILPDLYLKHFSTLVEATHLLLGEGISSEDLDRADVLLNVFVKSAEVLYGKEFMGLNVHSLLHLVMCVQKWGPLWAWSCFCFESFNGEIKKSIHGTGNVCRQIFWSIHAEKYIQGITLSDDNTRTRDFLHQLLSGNLISETVCLKARQCSVLHAKDIPEGFLYFKDISDQLSTLTGTNSKTEFLKAAKIIRNGYVMYSKLCTKVKKRNSYCIRLTETNDFMEVEYYLYHVASNHVFAVGKCLRVVGGVLSDRVPHTKEVEYDR